MRFSEKTIISPACRERFLDQQQFPQLARWGVFLAGLSSLHEDYHIERQAMGYHIVLVTLAGEAQLQSPQADTRKLVANDILLVPATNAFRYQLTTSGYWKTAWFLLEPQPHWQHFQSGIDIIKDTQLACRFAQTLQSLAAESDPGDPDAKVLQKLFCEQAYVLLNRLLRRVKGEFTAANPRLHSLLSEIEQTPAQTWNIAQMCEYSHYSRAQLTRLFNQYYGMSPSRKVAEIKMHYSALMLRTTRLPVNQIATMVGFDNPYNFSSRFKQMMSFSPKQYRQNATA